MRNQINALQVTRQTSTRVAAWMSPMLILATSILFIYVLDPAFSAFPGWKFLVLNALPVALLSLLVCGASGRLLLSIWLTGGVAILLFVLNGLKERNMHAPLMPSDAELGKQLTLNPVFFLRYLDGHWWAVVFALAFFGGAWFLARAKWPWARIPLVLRSIFICISAFGFYGLVAGKMPWSLMYSEETLEGFELWNPISEVDRVGLVAGFVHMSLAARISVPAPDSNVVASLAKDLRADLSQRASRLVPANPPDIVVVQSEAFFDPGILKGIEAGQYTPRFENLASKGISGPLAVPTYGGGTIRTEFEVLTGYPVLAFPTVEYPYYGLVGAWMPSVPRRLEAFGYSTEIFHPFRGNFWNRKDALTKLGIEHAHYDEDFMGSAHAGSYVSDRALFDKVLTHLETYSGKPRYTFVITMENHGPWEGDVSALADSLARYPLPKGLSPSASKQLTYYLAHLTNGDAALGDFASKLLARPKWTVLIFYGDHLPALDAVFNERGFDDASGYDEQGTRYLMVSNRTTDARQLSLHSYELPGLLFDYIGLPEDGYLALSAAARDKKTDQSQVLFDAARMEVLCRRRITAEGKCATQSK